MLRRLTTAALALLSASAFSADDPKKDRSKEISAYFAAPLARIEIEIKDDTMQQLRDEPRIYNEVRLTERDNKWKGVALKLKGAEGSFKPIDDKPGLTLDFDKFKGAERFHGQKKIHLNNANEDQSFLREWLTGEIAHAAGVPAGRCTHALVSINGRDKGLYVVRESFTKDFLRAHFGDADGALFEGHFCKDIDAELELDLGGDKARERLKELIAACDEEDAAKRWERLGRVLDIGKYARFLAFEVLVEFSDSYDFFKNNYRLHLDAKSGKFSFVLHGMDQAMNNPDRSIQGTPESKIGRIFWSHPEGQRLYRAQLTELYAKVLASGDWPAKLDARAAFVVAAMKAQGSRSAREFAHRADAMKADLLKRIESVGQQIAEWPEPLTFDAKGVASLPKEWRTETDSGDVEHDDGEAELRLAAKGEAVASWRRSVALEAGRYRFEASARAKGLDAIEDEKGRGAGLRISGAETKRGNALAGDAAWTKLGYEFEVTEPREIVLVAEVRAKAGEVWFSKESLRLVKLP